MWNRHKMNSTLELVLLPYYSHIKVLQSCHKCLQKLLFSSFKTLGHLSANFCYLQTRNITVFISDFDRTIDKYLQQLCTITVFSPLGCLAKKTLLHMIVLCVQLTIQL